MPATAGTLWGILTQAQKEEVLDQLSDEMVARYNIYVEAIVEGAGLPELEGLDALEAYRAREPQVWARLQKEFPDDYERDMKDWGRLESRMVKHPSASSLTDRNVRNAASATPLGYG